MCRLFGLMANKEVEIRFSMLYASRSMRQLSEENPDGWGIGGFMDGVPVINKSPLKALEDEAFRDTAESLRSRSFVAHVRRATVSGPSYTNTHPFSDGHWLFAHNGTLKPPLVKQLDGDATLYRPEGRTDSERYFAHLLTHIRKAGDVKAGLRQGLQLLRRHGDYEAINFLLAEAGNLYAFRDARERAEQFTLHYLRRRNIDLHAHSGESRMLIEMAGDQDEQAVVVASEPLTADEPWRALANGELLHVAADLTVTSTVLEAP